MSIVAGKTKTKQKKQKTLKFVSEKSLSTLHYSALIMSDRTVGLSPYQFTDGSLLCCHSERAHAGYKTFHNLNNRL